MAQLKTQAVIDARDGKTITVPHEPQVNSGKGAAFYFEKRHAISGKRIYYSASEWASLDDAAKKRAGDMTEIGVSQADRVKADDLVTSIANANPAAKKAIIDMLRAELGIAPPPPVAPELPPAKAEKGGK